MMKRRCENYWYAISWDADLTKNIEEIMIRIDCDKVATEVIDDKDVCATCKKSVEFRNWLDSPEGRAEVERLNPWKDENDN